MPVCNQSAPQPHVTPLATLFLHAYVRFQNAFAMHICIALVAEKCQEILITLEDA